MTTDQSRADAVRATGISRRVSGAGGWILKDCSLVLPRGVFTAIVGPSGAGKTSLLYCLSGLDRPDEGHVTLAGTEIYRLSRERRARFLRSTVGFVFQQYNLVPCLDVEENVLLPQRLAHHRVPPDRVTEVLTQFGLLDKRRTAASALSGGEQQRATCCRAMLSRPAIVFADEPTGALDSMNSQQVLQTLRGLTTHGTTVVMVTHDADAAAGADRVIFIRDGSITGVSGPLTATRASPGCHRLQADDTASGRDRRC